jgi:osmotically-inducible protein OsmY
MSLDNSARGRRTDHEIEQDVLAELRVGQDVADQRFLAVTVEDGVVDLTGFAESYAQKLAIERAASRVVGVRDVRDYIEVRPRHADQRDDRDIESAAKRALQWDARLPRGIQAEVTNGVLRLRGVVHRFSQRDAAEEAVCNLVGVRDVVNEVKLATVPAPADLELDVEAAIRRRFGSECRDIWVDVADGVITLTGVIPTFAMLDDIERVVRSIPGVTRVVDQLLVAMT